MRNRTTRRDVLIWFGCVLFSTALAADESGVILTNIGQIRALSPTEITRNPSVRLQAVVTHYTSARSHLWVQDQFDGLRLIARGQARVKVGDRVSVTGQVKLVENTAQVEPTEIIVLGDGKLPDAPVKTALQLNKFSEQNHKSLEENRFVQAEGRVAELAEKPTRWLVRVESGTNDFWLELPRRTNDDVGKLMDASVRARGVCLTLPFDDGEKLYPTLLVQDLSDLTVLRPGRPVTRVDRFQIPVRTIASLARQDAVSKSNAEVHLLGTVLDQRVGESLVLRDGTGTISAETTLMTAINPQQQVDLWGTPAWDGAHIYLRNATFSIETSNAIQTQTAAETNRPAELLLLTNALQVRNLSPEQAAWKYPVRLHAVVTFYLPQRGNKFYVQDDTSGIYIRPITGLILKTGDRVEIDGVSDPGGFAPCVVPSKVSVIGTAPLPVPARATPYQLASGQYNSQWMEERGIVRSQSYENGLLQLKLSDAIGTLFVNVVSDAAPANMLDSVVRIQGVCQTTFNTKRQITGSAIWVPSLDYLQIEEAGVADPLSLPEQSILSLSQFHPREILPHRTKVSGVVTVCDPAHTFFIQNAGEGVHVLPVKANDVKPGDRVIVAGFPGLGDYGPVLRDAIFRVVGHGPLPTPKEVPRDYPLDPQFHNLWVQMTARLSRVQVGDHEEVLMFETGSRSVDARCFAPIKGEAPPLVGSVLRVTGVYRVLADEARMPNSFQLLVPSSENIGVLEQPSWWTTRHSMTLAGALAAVTTIAALWAFLLRRQVGEQTRRLRERLEHEAALEQRYREIFDGANDLIFTHDLDGRFTSINPAGLRVLGYSAEEIKQLTMDQVLAPEYHDDVRQLRETRLLAGEVVTCQGAFVTRDGRRVMTESSLRMTFKDGKPIGVEGIARDITERKRAEEQLSNSRQMLRTVLDTIPTRVFWKDRNSVFVGCNQALARDCGFTDPDQIVGKTDYETVSAVEADRYCADDRQVMETGQSKLNYEELQIRADGSTGWLRTSKVPLYDKDGQVNGMLGTYEDITERKHAAMALAEASSLLETLLENSPDYIYFKDRQSRFVRCSKAFLALFHVSDLSVLIGKTDFDFFSEEHARPAYEDEQEIIRTGRPLIGKLEKEAHPDGRVTWALTTKLPWRDKGGNIIGTFGISKNVTAIKEAEDKLAYERELFGTLLDNIPDAIYFKDLQSRFVRVGRSKTERSRGVVLDCYRAAHPSADPAELPPHLASTEQFGKYLIGKTDFDIYPEQRARSAYEDEQEIIRTGQAIIGKPESLTLPDGKVSWVLSTKMPWRDEGGNIIGTFGVSRDITALKQAEAELEVTHQRLLETSRLAGMAEVATDVLHNVGNVLNSVNVSCSLVLDRVKESKLSGLSKVSALLGKNRARLAEFLTSDPQGKGVPDYLTALAEYSDEEHATLLRETEQLRNNIDHIKQIVTMQQSYAKVAGVVEAVAVSQLVEDALHVNSAALQRHGVRVRREFQTASPIFTEKHKVLQILVNLIRNAKYALHDSERPDKLLTIKVGGNGDGHVKIEVADNGVGIPQENLTRIFAHGFTTRRNGHGFGLHSSALAVRELGGSLQVHSDGPDQGATFTLSLPQTPPTPAE